MALSEQSLGIIVMIIMAVISIYLFFIFNEKVKPHKKYIDWLLLVYAVFSLGRRYVKWIINEEHWKYLPFQVCYITMFVFIYYLFLTFHTQ